MTRKQRVTPPTESPADRPPILRRYLEVAPGGRPHIPVDRRAPLADFEQVATEYPVFRIREATNAPPDGTREPPQAGL